jgi:hypothetical protein
MIDAILVFLTAWVVSGPSLVLFCMFGIWAEYIEARGFAVFWALVATISSYFYFNVSILDIGFYALGYLVVGVIWSFYRYKRFIVAKVESLREMNTNLNRLGDYHPSKMLDTITAWIIIWPFSLIENLCGDIINGIETLVKRVFKGVYNRIYEKAIQDEIYKQQGN